MKKITVFFFSLLISFSLWAQNKSSLKLDEIMKGKEFVGFWPEDVHWSYNSQNIYFKWNPQNDLVSSWYAYNLADKKTHKLSNEELLAKIPKQVSYSADKTKMIYTRNGDIYEFDIVNSKERRLTNTLANESEPVYSKDGKNVFYQLDNNMFKWDLLNHSITQITDFSTEQGNRKAEHQTTQEQWVRFDRMDLFSVFKEDDALKEASQNLSPKSEEKKPLKINIGKGIVWGLQMSPDERYVTYIKMIRVAAKRTNVPNYVTKSGYVEIEKARPKVGSGENTYEFWIFDTKENKAYPLKTANIDGIKDWPEPYNGIMAGKRKLTIGELKYSDNGENAVLVVRSQDNKDLWLLLVDLKTGEPSVLNRQTDEAWVGGPGIGTYWPNSNFGWMPDNENVYFQWEKTGYSHLYTVNIKSKKVKALTKGKFEIYEAYLSKDKSKWYLLTNEVHPGERQFYSMPLKGGERTRLTQATGYNESILSPDEKYIAIRYSSATQPWELFLQENLVGGEAMQITHSQTKAFANYQWRTPKFITFKARDGKEVYSRLYEPDLKVKNNAAVVFVHGAGYLQNAHKYWSSYYREMMFHNLLADNGYTVIDIDYRGSEGYGRDWRTGIYQHMGGKDLSDNVDAAKFLVDNYDIDASRIGIYGGSYGGFITLMAMFTTPDVFKCGAGLRSVTNWSNYNDGYTSNILNTPVVDPEAFRRSSPIYFADGLKGHLLILHGVRDDNVHFQDVVDLNQRLIELGKKNWEMAIFPMERHSFKRAASWTDEYRRIFELFQKELN